ncbi:SUMF1/EgtB/PvdO family nonheme iron enzyme, partial [Oscillatoria sp. HE19RPO]|uniref:formylglycine-generating enzyme family protein n=1 Tax=Oscillatoria sp. HE19RPO TaxID=2954806 RepID=UPI0020C57DE3
SWECVYPHSLFLFYSFLDLSLSPACPGPLSPSPRPVKAPPLTAGCAQYIFPWGNLFSSKKANTAETGIGETTKVGSFEEGVSKQGVYDLAGNVEEWTSSMYLPYSNGIYIEDHISDESGTTYPVLRGGSYRHHGDLCLATRRHGFRKNYSVSGFRVVKVS